ncbi:hypothetical protein [Streptomyces sp. NPDC005953]|uniref:hypothetical protein n=1 Tax=unclassified Streptomyces TaxID=2593676 RepID=UPI0033F7A631
MVKTQRCRARPQAVPKDKTTPVMKVSSADGRTSQSVKTFIDWTLESMVAEDSEVLAFSARANSPSVTPNQDAAAQTWTTRSARRVGRFNGFT